MIVPIALYLNLENTLIPRMAFPALVSSGRESYFEAIKTMDPRTHLIAPAKDWVMLATANPKLIDLLHKKEVRILPTLFSHVLPDLFPETLKMQFAMSTEILKKLFERITWHGIVPENAMSSVIVAQAEGHWEGAVLSVGHNNSRGLKTGRYQLEGKTGDKLPIQVIANASARLRYMQMYREEVVASAVLEDMRGHEMKDACLFDFERLWSNVVYYPHSGKSPVRMDIWKQFHRRISSEDISLWDFQDEPSEHSLVMDAADLGLWENKESHWLIAIQKDTATQCLGRGDYFELAALVASSCMPPRVLTRFMRNDSFPATHNGEPGVVDLVGDMSKVKEVLFICKNIQQKRRVDYGAEFLPKGERLYLELLHKALAWIDQHAT